MLDANLASLIEKLTETLQLAREREDDNRRDQRVQRIIGEFVDDHPTGCVRDKANSVLRRIDAAADDTTAGDIIRAGTARLRRTYELSTDPLTRVPGYDRFLVDLQNVPVLVRLADQGQITGAELAAAPAQVSGERSDGDDRA